MDLIRLVTHLRGQVKVLSESQAELQARLGASLEANEDFQQKLMSVIDTLTIYLYDYCRMLQRNERPVLPTFLHIKKTAEHPIVYWWWQTGLLINAFAISNNQESLSDFAITIFSRGLVVKSDWQNVKLD